MNDIYIRLCVLFEQTQLFNNVAVGSWGAGVGSKGKLKQTYLSSIFAVQHQLNAFVVSSHCILSRQQLTEIHVF